MWLPGQRMFAMLAWKRCEAKRVSTKFPMTPAVLWYGMEGSISQKVDENKRLRHQSTLVSLHHLCVCMIQTCVCVWIITISLQITFRYLRSLSGILRIHIVGDIHLWRSSILEMFRKCEYFISNIIQPTQSSAGYYLGDYFTMKAGFHGYPHPAVASRHVAVPWPAKKSSEWQSN